MEWTSDRGVILPSGVYVVRPKIHDKIVAKKISFVR